MDASGRSYVVVAFGPEAEQVAASWRREISQTEVPLTSLDSGADDSETLGRLSAVLSSATTGLRLMVAGPEQEVLAAASVARYEGMIDCELALHVTSADFRKVYCVHCKTTSSVGAAVEELASCQGCGQELLVFAHLSRRSGSYLGFLADAEERG